jgi:uncharacterized protein YbjT (DUF2867 family)
MIKKILVIGASGMIGRPVTKELVKAGFDCTLLARNPAKMEKLFPGCRVTEGDVLDPLSLLVAMEKQDAVYINLQAPRSVSQDIPLPEREGIDNIIETARHAGLKRITYISSLVQRYNGTNGYHWWIFDMKQSAVTKIRSCGMPYTIFYPSTFMENLDQLLRRGNKIMLAGESKAPMYFIAAEDYGRQVARSFQTPGNDNREYAVQGTEAYNWNKAAAIFIDHYKAKPMKVMKAPAGMLKFIGLFSRTVKYGYKIVTALNNYPERFESEKTWEQLGRPSITLAEYAARQSAIQQGGAV